MKRKSFLPLIVLFATIISPALLLAQSESVTSAFPRFDVGDYILTPVAAGFNQPVVVAQPADGSGRWFVATRLGKIWVVDGDTVLPEPFLDLTNRVTNQAPHTVEYGMHGLVFDPDYASNGQFYVAYQGRNEISQVERYQVSATNPNRADPESAEVILSLPGPFMEHTVAQLVFGPDGYFYIGSGDGGMSKHYVSDGYNLGQRLDELYGAILRIDLHTRSEERAYGIPPDNPFVDLAGAAGETWVYGLRNPHAFSFDPLTGDLYIGDIGLERWEEINIVPAGTSGQNFGWAYYEGHERVARTVRTPYQYGLDIPQPDNAVFPALTYNHWDTLGCAVIGGHVYRGQQLPALQGAYLYGDFCSGDIKAAWWATGYLRDLGVLVEGGGSIVGFALDEQGELYVVDYMGTLYRLAARGEVAPTTIPRFIEATPEADESES